MMALQESGEMYLETILILSKRTKFVRSLDVAEYMGFSKPSVSRAIKLLKDCGYIEVMTNGQLILTDDGKNLAEKIYERHTIITKFLISLGVSEKIAAEDACKMEHDISEESFLAMKNKIQLNP